MNEVLAELVPGVTRPRFDLIQGGGEVTPKIGALALVPTPRENFMLRNVDTLNEHLEEDGKTYNPAAIKSVEKNNLTGIYEGAIPYGVSEVDHEWQPSLEGRGGLILDLGKTAVQVAMGGYEYYQYTESRAFCDQDVAYAQYKQETLRKGIATLMIGAKMTRADASLEIAKAEGMADTDSIQVDYLAVGENNATVAKTATILAADVPIRAWVDMLADANNIFGRSVTVDDPNSALSVVKTFSQLEIAVDKLTEGPVTILAAVLRYIDDPVAHQKVAAHLEKFRGDQQAMRKSAQGPADRWTKFEMDTGHSLRAGFANSEIQSFIDSLDENWGEEDRAVIDAHKVRIGKTVKYRMTRPLAIILQNAERNLVLTAAAVVNKNQKVLAQMSSQVANQIYQHEMAIQIGQSMGLPAQQTALAINRIIARQNVTVGGGCSGDNKARFKVSGLDSIDDLTTLEIDETSPTDRSPENSWHGGRVKKGQCVNCKEQKDVGVKDWCKDCISGHCGSKKAA